MSKEKTIKMRVMMTLMNPEDYFNDLVEDGYSVHDALVAIMEGELVHAELAHMFPDGYMDEGHEDLGDGYYEVTLDEDFHNDDEKDKDEDGLERELIASDEDMAHA